jgi:alpha-D-ribose 1-methylphosphonate 5-triphosphate synthase subunit PhnH
MNALTPGFADAVDDAQACFRLVLDAMARPGRVHEVHGVVEPAPPLCEATACVVLTVLDHETPLWLDPAADAAQDWIAFHTGAPIIGDAPRAIFALALSPTDLVSTSEEISAFHSLLSPGLTGPPAPTRAATGGPDRPGHDGGIAGLPIGTDEAPETSATVILQVASVTTGRAFMLEGPGLREPELLTVDGLPADFAAIWQRNHALFPRGIDLILCAGNQLAALPRSVSVREA